MRALRFSLTLVSLGFCSQLVAEPAFGPNEALPELDWSQADQAVGKVALISGEVVGVGNAGRISFINFDTGRPPGFTGVIFGSSIDNFPEPLEETYQGKKVQIRGMVTTYRDKPQISITHPDQIEILTELPPKETSIHTPEPMVVEGQVVLATYNVLNLFDDQDDPHHSDESTPPKSRAAMENLAESITALGADVIAMQEVENRGYLQRFLDVLLPEMGYQHVVHFEGNDLRGIDVCLISRVPIGPVRSFRHLTFAGPDGTTRHFSRDLLAVTLEPEGAEPFEMWVVHLKSNSGGREFAEPIRLAEAAQLRALLDEQLEADPQARIVVTGDFNDTWGSQTLETIVGSGSTALWSAASDLGDEPHVTFNTGEFRSMIDFILCTPAMAKTYVANSCRIVPGSPESTGSDHNPVAASFSLDR